MFYIYFIYILLVLKNFRNFYPCTSKSKYTLSKYYIIIYKAFVRLTLTFNTCNALETALCHILLYRIKKFRKTTNKYLCILV